MTTVTEEKIAATAKAIKPNRYSLGQLISGDIRAWLTLWEKVPTDARLPLGLAVKYVFNQCGLRATILHRFAFVLWRNKIPILPGMVSRLNLTLHGFDVPCRIRVGPGFYVPHPVGTVIMAKTIGSNVTLVSAVTIGMRNVPEFPTIGNGVLIGAGARVLGGITIGDNVNIGANAVVVTDVPEGATAVGIPARIIPARSSSLGPAEKDQ
jgi:serine O-acetyltransferase